MSLFLTLGAYPMMIGHVVFIFLILGATLNREIYVIYFKEFICLSVLKFLEKKLFVAFMTGILNCESMF